MKILVTGSTGMAGSEVIRQAILDDSITAIYALARKPLNISHPKLKPIIHTDFLNYKGLENYFAECNACIWCLGISQLQATKEQLAITTVDYTIAAAKAMLAANPTISFIFLSGNGADRNEKSKIPFAKLKGKAENELLKLNFTHLAIARPDAIWPKHKHTTAPFAYKLAFPFYPLVELLAPSKIIKSDVLAKALIHLAKNKLEKDTFENMELRKLGMQLL
jgi:uncharacterized protein YbjT (DUF2867 family)